MPVLAAVVFLAAVAEAALHFASWAKLEDELEGQATRRRYLRYLEQAKSIHALCVLVRIAATAAFVTLVVLGAKRPLPAVAAGAAVLILAEWMARLIGRKWSWAILIPLLPVLYGLSFPLRPLRALGRRSNNAQDEEPEPEVVEAAKEEIRVAIEDGATEGAIEVRERQMIEGILKFGDVDVAEIMTPRTDMECLEADLLLPAAIRALERFHHSRIPVYEGTLDKTVGIAYVKDLLSAVGREDGARTGLRDIVRPPLFVPETQTVGPLLRQFQREHMQIAVVLDEYGGVSGIVTVEDIMEEIVGEIEDEYDQEDHENRIRVRSSGAIEVDARVHIDEINELLGLDIPDDEDYDTVGGYVTARFARVPQAGEERRDNGLLVRILQSDPRRVRRVFLKREEGQH